MQDVKPLVTQKEVVENQDESLPIAILYYSEYRDSSGRNRIHKILVTSFATSWMFRIGTSKEKTKPVFMNNRDNEN